METLLYIFVLTAVAALAAIIVLEVVIYASMGRMRTEMLEQLHNISPPLRTNERGAYAENAGVLVSPKPGRLHGFDLPEPQGKKTSKRPTGSKTLVVSKPKTVAVAKKEREEAKQPELAKIGVDGIRERFDRELEEKVYTYDGDLQKLLDHTDD